MDRALRSRNRTNFSLKLKSSSLHFLNDISNFNSTENLNTDISNWRDSYTFHPVILGRGHFSKVYKAKYTSSGKYVAIKVIRRRRLGVDKIDEIMKEIEMMKILNQSLNSGFIQLLKYHTSLTEVAVLIEFASGGSIYHVIRESQTGLPETYTRIILSKIISALTIMHGQNIVHLDIKADNILLRHPYPSTDVAIADFGLARKLSKTKVHKEMIGTPDYIAPEVANYDSISTKSDMWSIGVFTYFTLTNISPFCADTKEETLNRVTKAQFEFVGQLKNENLEIAKDFINHLIIKIPEKRLSADECLNHDFLSSVPLVEYPTIQNSDKATVSINVISDIDTLPLIRENTNYKIRALVTSQYDFETYDNTHLEETRNDLLKPSSVYSLADLNRSLNSFNYSINDETNKDSEVRNDKNNKDSEVYNDKTNKDSEVHNDKNNEDSEVQMQKSEIEVLSNSLEPVNSEELPPNMENIKTEKLQDTILIDNSEIPLPLIENSNNDIIENKDILKSNIDKDIDLAEIPDQNNEITNENESNLNNKINFGDDLTNLTVYDEVTADTINVSFVENHQLSSSSLTSSNYDSTNDANLSSDSNSLPTKSTDKYLKIDTSINQDNTKENNVHLRDKFNNFRSTMSYTISSNKIYDSKRYIKSSLENSQLKSDSFRYSRDNLVDQNFLIMYENADSFSNHRKKSCHVISRMDYNTIPLHGAKSSIKKRPLSKCLKKDFDKPLENQNRRSQLIISQNNLNLNSECDVNISKSHPVLNEIQSVGSKRVKNHSKTPEVSKHRSSKKSEKKFCIIS